MPHCPPERPVCGHSQAGRRPPPHSHSGPGLPDHPRTQLPSLEATATCTSCGPAPPHPCWRSGHRAAHQALTPAGHQRLPQKPRVDQGPPSQPPQPSTRDGREPSCRPHEQHAPHSGVERELPVALRGPDRTHAGRRPQAWEAAPPEANAEPSSPPLGWGVSACTSLRAPASEAGGTRTPLPWPPVLRDRLTGRNLLPGRSDRQEATSPAVPRTDEPLTLTRAARPPPPPPRPVVHGRFLFVAVRKTRTLPSGALCPSCAIEAEGNLNSPAKAPGTVHFLGTATPARTLETGCAPKSRKALAVKGHRRL